MPSFGTIAAVDAVSRRLSPGRAADPALLADGGAYADADAFGGRVPEPGVVPGAPEAKIVIESGVTTTRRAPGFANDMQGSYSRGGWLLRCSHPPVCTEAELRSGRAS